MKPTKIVLQRTATHFQLRVFFEGRTTVIESTPINTGASLPGLRKYAAKYARRFSIPFVDEVL